MRKVKVITNKPVAVESPDHLEPCGTRNDNTTSDPFVDSMIARFGPTMTYLDLGCAGGGFVKQFIDRGVLGVGLEGSDYSKMINRAEWATIPDYLFTCDLTVPFDVVYEDDGSEVKFDVVSAWDVMEHFTQEQLDFVIPKIKSLLKDDGVFVASICSLRHDPYHQTVEEEPWWHAKFAEYGLVKVEDIPNYGRHSSFQVTYKKNDQT